MLEIMDNVINSDVETRFAGLVINVYDADIVELVDINGIYKVLLWLKIEDFPIIQREDELLDGNSF